MRKASIKQHVQYLVAFIIASLTVVVTTLFVTGPASAMFDQGISEGAEEARGVDQVTDLFGVDGVFTTVTNVLLYLIGAISVIMIIIGGMRYILSGGDSNNVTAAKNTILYAVVGIVVALLGYAVVNFVITSFSATGGAGGSGGF